ncbi:PREDICTED: rho GDP-dissociation inhibitor 3 [Crocodylus porosus]|uniref:rho GDP-dissociation inhibitor 3 n=1 Tax=Crocodylus porosus TaxID=8502 RepID=UPI000938F679|nr:PREDICTED: rho GDP-dissociation inhibitor 3 [Crocodylus porosus]
MDTKFAPPLSTGGRGERCKARLLWPPSVGQIPAGVDIVADKDGVTLSLEEDVDDVHLAYKTPEKKSLQEIQQLDQDDESLNKYKQALLGPIPVAVDPNLPNIQVTRMTLVCDQAPGPLTMDLAGDLEALKSQSFVLKEGVDYRVKISFKVNREIVCGLKYLHHTYRKGLKMDRDIYMVGSYGPRAEEYEFLTPMEEAPKGMLVRGTYHIKSFFTDDDKTDHLSWAWNLCIKKDWKD